MEKIIIIGSGGHALSVIDVIEQAKQFEITMLASVAEDVGKTILKYRVTQEFSKLLNSSEQINGINFVLGIGFTGREYFRKRYFDDLLKLGAQFPSIVSPWAYVSPHAKIGAGTVIHHRAIINAGVTIGNNCIINTGAIVEHGSSIGNHCHISTGAIINGNCVVGNECFVGSHAVFHERTHLKNNSTLGANSFLKGEAEEGGMYVGSPARKIPKK